MRIVLDANVLVSGLLSPKGPPGQILDAWLSKRFDLFLSETIFDELRRVMHYPHIQERLSPGQSNRLLAALIRNTLWVEGNLELDVLKRDPSDNPYLACAVEAGADYLVSGNALHFEEAGEIFRGVKIVSPRQFLDILKSTA
jgi:putative PIN family toxin of toxin-antitoxin system